MAAILLNMPTKSKRPRDSNQLAHLITQIATGDVEDNLQRKTVVRASKAGTKGGPARAAALTREQRSEIARIAASARWKKST